MSKRERGAEPLTEFQQFSHLPPEVVEHAVKHMKVKVFLNMARTNSVYAAMSRQEKYWKLFYARDFPAEYTGTLPFFCLEPNRFRGVRVDGPAWFRFYMITCYVYKRLKKHAFFSDYIIESYNDLRNYLKRSEEYTFPCPRSMCILLGVAHATGFAEDPLEPWFYEDETIETIINDSYSLDLIKTHGYWLRKYFELARRYTEPVVVIDDSLKDLLRFFQTQSVRDDILNLTDADKTDFVVTMLNNFEKPNIFTLWAFLTNVDKLELNLLPPFPIRCLRYMTDEFKEWFERDVTDGNVRVTYQARTGEPDLIEVDESNTIEGEDIIRRDLVSLMRFFSHPPRNSDTDELILSRYCLNCQADNVTFKEDDAYGKTFCHVSCQDEYY